MNKCKIEKSCCFILTMDIKQDNVSFKTPIIDKIAMGKRIH